MGLIVVIVSCQCAAVFFSPELYDKSVMVSWFVALMGLVQSNCRMKELFKHDYCCFIIRINLRYINFEKKNLATEDVQQKPVDINGFLHRVAVSV